FTDSGVIDQPAAILSEQNNSTVISCSHNDNNLDVMLWYQQLPSSRSLALIGYGYAKTNPSYEPGFEPRFRLTRKDTTTGALTISKLGLLDSGMVRCANVQQNPASVFANKSETAELNCSYDDSSKPNMLWYQQKDSSLGLILLSYGASSEPFYEDGFKDRFKLERTVVLDATLKISALSLSDSAVYYCAVSNKKVCLKGMALYFNFTEPQTLYDKQLSMDAFLLLVILLCLRDVFSDNILITQWPEYISSPVGSTVNMHCFQNDTDYDYKYWYRHVKGEGPVLIGSYIVSSSTNEKGFETGFKLSGTGKKKWSLSLNLTMGIDAVYLCAASLHNPKLDIIAPNVSIIEPSKKEQCKKKITLVCLAENFYPDHVKIKWFVGNKERKNGVATDPEATKVNDMYTMSSRLELPRKAWKKSSNKFTCEVDFFNGAETIKQTKSVNGIDGGYDRASNITLPKVKIHPPSPKETCSQKNIMTLVCTAWGFYPDHVTLSWIVNGLERKDNISTDHSAQQDKRSLMYQMSSRMKITYSEWVDPSNVFNCSVQFFNGEEYITVSNTLSGEKGFNKEETIARRVRNICINLLFPL
ncbi:hypothetical protein DNTS_014426, partial [Danionella cerebrum]